MSPLDNARIIGRTQMAAAMAHDALRWASESADPRTARHIKTAMDQLAGALQFARDLGDTMVPATVPAGV